MDQTTKKPREKKRLSMKEQNKKELRQRILVALGVVLLIVALIGIFLVTNYQRSVIQNGMYLEASTNQTLKRLDDTFQDSQQSIHMAATLYEEVLPADDEICGELATLVSDTPFSYIAIEMADGTTYNSRGKVSQAPSSPHHITKPGAATVNDGRIGQGTSIVFYQPVYDGDTYLGVLSGVWSNEMLEETISASFFNELTSTYLCANDGTIIARSSEYVNNDTNVLDIYAAGNDAGNINTSATVGELQESMDKGEAISFTYDSPRGLGMAYMVNLADHDWVLLRTYPMAITDSIVENINFIGISVILVIVVAFGLLVAFMMAQNARRNTSITEEREQFKRVVEASSTLFKRFAIIDLQKQRV